MSCVSQHIILCMFTIVSMRYDGICNSTQCSYNYTYCKPIWSKKSNESKLGRHAFDEKMNEDRERAEAMTFQYFA